MNNLEKKLREGLKEIDLSLNDEKISLLMKYLDEFHKWNKAYNLYAVRNQEEMVTRHLLDSLVLVSCFEKFCASKTQVRVIAVGTGCGWPGIPLAIVFPQIQFVLLDSNGKKTRFLFQVKTL